MILEFGIAEAALAWLDANAAEGGAYTIVLNADETIAPKLLSYSGKTVSVTLEGGAAERTVNLNSNGSLFTVESGVTLTMGNNVTLRGWSDNTDSLVRVNIGGMLVMNVGNTNFSGTGGGVYVNSDGTFVKQSSVIIYGSDTSAMLKNTAYSDDYGHAVFVDGSSGGWE
jgi:hypothetical protein